jgi:hypothetical protein
MSGNSTSAKPNAKREILKASKEIRAKRHPVSDTVTPTKKRTVRCGPRLAVEPSSSPSENRAFANALKKVLSIPHSDLQARLARKPK